MKNRLWGLILIVLGVLLLLQVTGVFNLGLSFWPVVLVLLGLVILWGGISTGFTSWFLIALGLWVGGIGLFNILSAADLTSLTGSDIARYGWPLILVAIGLSVLFGGRACFAGRFICGSQSDHDKKGSCSHMRHIGDLYHGRSSWVLDKDMEFYHGIGDVVIDLTTAEIMPGSYKIFLKVGAGEVNIKVPGGVTLEVAATVGVGELDLFGEERSGIGGLSLSKTIDVEGSEATVTIEAKLGLGDMTVQYLPAIPGAAK